MLAWAVCGHGLREGASAVWGELERRSPRESFEATFSLRGCLGILRLRLFFEGYLLCFFGGYLRGKAKAI